jgi:hypothetical protein
MPASVSSVSDASVREELNDTQQLKARAEAAEERAAVAEERAAAAEAALAQALAAQAAGAATAAVATTTSHVQAAARQNRATNVRVEKLQAWLKKPPKGNPSTLMQELGRAWDSLGWKQSVKDHHSQRLEALLGTSGWQARVYACAGFVAELLVPKSKWTESKSVKATVLVTTTEQVAMMMTHEVPRNLHWAPAQSGKNGLIAWVSACCRVLTIPVVVFVAAPQKSMSQLAQKMQPIARTVGQTMRAYGTEGLAHMDLDDFTTGKVVPIVQFHHAVLQQLQRILIAIKQKLPQALDKLVVITDEADAVSASSVSCWFFSLALTCFASQRFALYEHLAWSVAWLSCLPCH